MIQHCDSCQVYPRIIIYVSGSPGVLEGCQVCLDVSRCVWVSPYMRGIIRCVLGLSCMSEDYQLDLGITRCVGDFFFFFLGSPDVSEGDSVGGSPGVSGIIKRT